MTRGRVENLSRGSADQAAIASAAAAEQRAEERAFETRAETDIDATLIGLFASSSLAAKRGLDKWNRGRGEPSRLTIEATKEARQLAQTLEPILKARGIATEAERFFTQMETRLAAANVGEGVRPIRCPGCGDPL